MESMEIDDINESNGSVPRERENGFKLFPVSPEESGEGLPYAPVDFPQRGDVWRWKVGRRVALNGHYLDRYLYLPRRLRKIEVPARSKSAFASKLSVERYIRTAHPEADVDAFFASFSWKIPAKKLSLINGQLQFTSLFLTLYSCVSNFHNFRLLDLCSNYYIFSMNKERNSSFMSIK
ncbi:hypothetical protein SLEP1_g49855 [Rubroshorea leprosula]|uniref:DUF7081 domain-containing protein n=1 Tax=Rubroshorea leprosula TaxID=152421 RepID=A0AAV5LY45_9ROSI|nr:hypothetical protein SLEP1_g49855 [Rubroshorea leprosula]